MNRIQLLAFVIASFLAVTFCSVLCEEAADGGAAAIELESRINPNVCSSGWLDDTAGRWAGKGAGDNKLS